MTPQSRDVVILSGARTPTGRFEGAMATVPATELGATAIRAAVERSNVDPAAVSEVLMGCVLQAALGQAPARQASLKAGMAPETGATTFNKVCGSSLKTVVVASQAIRCGDDDCIVAGGMENMFLAPYALQGARAGYRLNNKTVIDIAVNDGLWCSFQNWHMGAAAEWVAEYAHITRERQDAFAVASHQKAIAAIESGAFKREIAPVAVTDRKGKVTVIDVDETPRADTNLEALARLKPAFVANGTVTAGNAPGLCEGAAAMVISGGDWAAANGLKPMARVLGHGHAALEPTKLFLAPIGAIQNVLARTGLSLADVDLFEINEAFAAQVLADGDGIPGWDWSKVNVRGGAIALGHPIGASGARIMVTLVHALQDTGGRRGVAAACLGGGEAVAVAVELV
jgi:acetyl-CoA C-acetyltransferase